MESQPQNPEIQNENTLEYNQKCSRSKTNLWHHMEETQKVIKYEPRPIVVQLKRKTFKILGIHVVQ